MSTASDKGTDTAASTDDDAKAGSFTDGTSKPTRSKGGRDMVTSGDESAGDKITKANVPAKAKPTKKPNRKAEDQKTKTIQMLKGQMKAMTEEKRAMAEENKAMAQWPKRKRQWPKRLRLFRLKIWGLPH